ncbi:hypothetical protein PYCCODRAFT_1465908 [Trametes coccinea BRFM310]|uniref:Uncharacterized protein n=1 Tax=Trametes coccinea (strain BRFM310) TaxID=1353009 RepID=A0A1Y2IW40_TRAC3|nr:hypothetical protein PYCCODRAFT_1465908 [Trametes coccinea BRFM310]
MASIPRNLHPVHVNTSSYSSLAHAVTGGNTSSQTRVGTKSPYLIRRTPVPTAATSSSGRTLLWPRHTVVVFERVSPTCDGSRAVPFSEIKQGRIDLLRNGSEPIFSGFSQCYIEFKILWPGYRHLDWHCNLDLIDGNGKPITRFEFARTIVGAYERFFERARRSRYGGPEKENARGSWDLSGDLSRYAFALKSVHNRDGHEGVFQADVEIISYC